MIRMECYTAVSMNETDLHGSTWMDCTSKKIIIKFINNTIYTAFGYIYIYESINTCRRMINTMSRKVVIYRGRSIFLTWVLYI